MSLNDEEFFQEIGHRLRARREELRWSQAELARRCGLHKAYVGFVERGERNASLVNLRRIAKALRLKLSDLLKGLEAGDYRAPRKRLLALHARGR